MKSWFLLGAGVLLGVGAAAWASPPERPTQHWGHVETAATFEIVGGKALVRMISAEGAYLGIIEGRPGLSVPEHVHADSIELLYVLEGTGWMTIAGKREPVRPGMGIQVPANTPHSFEIPADATAGFKAVQVYTAAGPQARFRNGRALAPGTEWSRQGTSNE